MQVISKEEFDKICKDYKGTYSAWNNGVEAWVGRRTAMLPGEGTALSIEGVHFLVEGDYTHLPTLRKDNARIGECYHFGRNGYLTVKKLYRLTEEEAKKKGLLMLDRVTATIYNRGKSHDSDFALAGSDLL